jgi:pheromone shutdown protein TraB
MSFFACDNDDCHCRCHLTNEIPSLRCSECRRRTNRPFVDRRGGLGRALPVASLVAVVVIFMCDAFVVLVDSTSTTTTTSSPSASATVAAPPFLSIPLADDLTAVSNPSDDASISALDGSGDDDNNNNDNNKYNNTRVTTRDGNDGSISIANSNVDADEEETSEMWMSESVQKSNVTVYSADETSNLAVADAWKRRLPHPLSNKTRTLQRLFVAGPHPTAHNSMVEVYLLGTAHVSTDSSREVRLLLETVDPDVVFVELCNQRAPMLVSPPPPPPATVDGGAGDTSTVTEAGPGGQQAEAAPPTPTTVWGRLRGKFLWGQKGTKRVGPTKKGRHHHRRRKAVEGSDRSMFTKATTLLTSLQQDTADSLGVEVGGEFRVAYDYWDAKRKQQGNNGSHDDSNGASPAPGLRQPRRQVHLVLGDRLFQSTLIRAWESLRWWGKFRLVVGLLVSSLVKPDPEEIRAWMKGILEDDGSDLLTKSMEELAKAFPTLTEVIIHERDVYMACKVYQTCMYMLHNCRPSDPQRFRMVVIVGAGHIEGMCRWLTSPPSEQPEATLSRLVQLRSRPPTEEELAHAIYDVVTVDPEYMEQIAQQMREESTQMQEEEEEGMLDDIG